jgi:hypothetical protein
MIASFETALRLMVRPGPGMEPMQRIGRQTSIG